MKNKFLLFILLGSLVLTQGCQKEYSFERGEDPSEGTLLDDGSGDCFPMTVAGVYVMGTVLNGAVSYIEVQVDVTLAGAYTIYTDTVNGIYFRDAGNFTTTGPMTVRLKGNGTPLATGIHNFIVRYGTSGCTISVTTSGSLATFTLDGSPGGCTGATPAGTYAAGTPLNASNTVTMNVNVTALGAYNVSTIAVNGMSFASSGTFAALGPLAIVLTGSGTPLATGTSSIPVTAGSSSCSFPITVVGAVPPATFSVDCASAVVNGTYTAGTPLGAANTVSIGVNVTVAGSYTISTTPTNGMTFNASGNFTATGAQVIILTGSGTPASGGTSTIPVPSGSPACNFQVTVAGGGGAAVFVVNCPTAVANGTYRVGTALTATNTVTINVNITTPGSYTITTTLTNGMSFSASGNFATAGTQTITLTGSGTPATAGNTSIPVPSGTTPCNFSVNVLAAGAAAVFTVNCASAIVNGIYTEGVPLIATNTVTIDVNVTTAGSYTIATTSNNNMIFSATGNFAGTGIQSITLTGSGTPFADGTFTIDVPSGTTPCNFDLDVDPAAVSLGTWSFREGTTTFSGIIDDAALDPTLAPPYNVIYFTGPTAAGHYFEVILLDVSTVFQNGETYSAAAAVPGPANAGSFYFESPAAAVLYTADPFTLPNTIVITVTTHNPATRTVTGTFTGTAQDATGNAKAITNGVFSFTYP